MDWTAIAVGAGSGLFAGYATNKLALKMLFWPRTPVLGTFGVFPANQDRMAEEVGRTVSTQVLTQDSMRAHLTSAELKGRIESEIRAGVDGLIFRRYNTLDDLAKLLVPDDAEREAISSRLASMTGAWLSSLASNAGLRQRLSVWLTESLEGHADSTLGEVLPSTASELVVRLANHVVGVVRDHGPGRIKEAYRAWLASDAPLRQWIGRIDPSVADAVAGHAGELAASFASGLAKDPKVAEWIVRVVSDQIDEALRGNDGTFFGSIRAHLLRVGWRFVQDDALVRLQEQLPRLVAEIAAFARGDDARALVSREVQVLTDRALDTPVRDLWAKCPKPAQESLFQLLDNTLESPHLWALVRDQVDAGVDALLGMRLGQLLPVKPVPSQPDRTTAAAPPVLPGVPVVAVVAAADSAPRLRRLFGFPSSGDTTPLGLVYDSAGAGAEPEDSLFAGQFTSVAKSSLARGAWAVAVLDGTETQDAAEAIVGRADALVVHIDAVKAGAWMARFPWQEMRKRPTPLLLVRAGTPTPGETAGRWRDHSGSAEEKLASMRIAGDTVAGVSYQTVFLDALDSVASLRDGHHAIVPEAAPSALKDALESHAAVKAAGLVGLTALEAWLRAALREVVPPTAAAASSWSHGSRSGAQPRRVRSPYQSLVDTVADYVTPGRAQAWAQAAWGTARGWPVGVPAERISEGEARELTRAISRRLFDLLEENAARVAQSIDVATMARDRVAALDPHEVESAVGRMSMGAFWWLEVLGGFFGLLAAALLAALYQWSPLAGAVAAAILSIASIGLMAQAKIQRPRSNGG